MKLISLFIVSCKETFNAVLGSLKKVIAFFKSPEFNIRKIAANPCLIIPVIFIILFIIAGGTALKIENPVFTDQTGTRAGIVLPFFYKTQSSVGYTVSGTIRRHAFSQRWIKIIPDDMVESISINGRSLPLTGISQASLSDYINGFNFNLGPCLNDGDNLIEIRVTNFGGNSGLDIEPSESDWIVRVIIGISAVLLLFLFVRIFHSFKLDKLFPDAGGRVLLLSLVLAAILIRFFMIQFRAGDFEEFIEWYNFIKANGGFAGLKHGFSEYPPFWSYLLLIGTFIPIAKVAAIKIIIFIFDFMAAGVAASIAGLKYNEKKEPIKAAFAFFTVLLAPTVLFNSSYWGQCDIIWTGFIILSINYFLKGKKAASMASFGLALSFKITAFLLTPLYFILLIKKSIPFRYFFILPAVYIATFIPAFIAGRPFSDLIDIYSKQTGLFGGLSVGCPNFYQWVNDKIATAFTPAGIMLAIAAVLFLSFIVYQSREKINREIMIKLSLLTALVVPFFLPRMHERYYFPADVLSIIYGFYFPRYAYIPVIVNLISYFSYLPFMMGMPTILPLQFLSVIILAVIILVARDLFKSLYPAAEKDVKQVE